MRRDALPSVGVLRVQQATASTCTPRIFPAVSARAKFMRPRSAEEFTQASAFME